MNFKEKKPIDPKKRLLIIIGIVVIVIVLLFAVSYAIDTYYKSRDNNAPKPIDFDFFPVNYKENIYDDEDYTTLIKDGFISYTDGATGVTIGINTDNLQKYGVEVEFMVDYIYTIINGDADAYNAFFTAQYFKNNKKHERFTMQKLYDVNITKLAVNDVGGNTVYEFTLEYKILENNGTFRNDIGDGSKKQYITVTTENGKLLISSISTANFAVNKK